MAYTLWEIKNTLWEMVDTLSEIIDKLWEMVDTLWEMVDTLWGMVDTLWEMGSNNLGSSFTWASLDCPPPDLCYLKLRLPLNWTTL